MFHRIWSWIRSLRKLSVDKQYRKPSFDEQYRDFLIGLTSQKTPNISSRWVCGVFFVIELDFNDVKVTLEYNYIYEEWKIIAWSKELRDFLFYYDCLNPTPIKSIRFVCDKYGLDAITKAAVEAKLKEAETSKQIAESVISKYTVRPN